MQLTKNFSLNEFNPRGLNMTLQHTENFRLLAQNLQAIRDFVGVPVSITSGLRSLDHNSSLKGASKTSQHLHGEACDIVIAGLDSFGLDDMFNRIIYLGLVLPNPCSQIIRESNGKGAEWIHMGLKTMRWLEVQKNVIADHTTNVFQKNKATKRLTACECLITKDTKTFNLVKHIPYGDFG